MIFATLKDILINLGIDEGAIHENAHLRKDLELDSTETVEIALELKNRLGIQVKIEARQDPTLAEICAKVEQAKANSL
jgi:acyl carrier protein